MRSPSTTKITPATGGSSRAVGLGSLGATAPALLPPDECKPPAPNPVWPDVGGGTSVFSNTMKCGEDPIPFIGSPPPHLTRFR